jgi:hypothetical protein
MVESWPIHHVPAGEQTRAQTYVCHRQVSRSGGDKILNDTRPLRRDKTCSERKKSKREIRCGSHGRDSYLIAKLQPIKGQGRTDRKGRWGSRQTGGKDDQESRRREAHAPEAGASAMERSGCCALGKRWLPGGTSTGHRGQLGGLELLGWSSWRRHGQDGVPPPVGAGRVQ